VRHYRTDRRIPGVGARLTSTIVTPYNALHTGGSSDVRRVQLLDALFFFFRSAQDILHRFATRPPISDGEATHVQATAPESHIEWN
jgi:hypothetical protein